MAASPSLSAISIRPCASPSSFSRLRTAASEVSSLWRSRISFCASCGLFQMAGSSDLAFSSSSRRVALSQSKMPPQQGDGLLDLFDGALHFGAHDDSPPAHIGSEPPFVKLIASKARPYSAPASFRSPAVLWDR